MILEYRRKGNVAAFVFLIFIFGATFLTTIFKESTAFNAQETIYQVIGIVGGISFFYMLWAYAKAKGHSGWWALSGFGTVLGLIILLALKDKHKYDLKNENDEVNRTVERIEGINGWLFVVAFGVVVAPFVQLSALIELAETYNNLIITSGQISPALNFLLYLEMFGSGTFLTWACFNIYLFFNKKIALKNSLVGFLCINWLFVVVDLFAAQLVADLLVTSDEVARTAWRLIAILAWSFYIFRSKRVKNTFIHGNEDSRYWKIQASILVLGGFLCFAGIILFTKLSPAPVITEEMLKAEARGVMESPDGQMVGEGVRLDGAVAVGMTFTFNYTLLDGAADEWDVNEIVATFRPEDLEHTCSNLGGWLEAGVTVQYQYSGNDGLPVATLDFKDGDCPDLDQRVSEDGVKLSPRDIASNAKSSFVSITGYVGQVPSSNGSGFIVRQDGVIVTNLHVLQGIETLTVKLPNGEIYDRVFVLDVDEQRDLAILQIPATGLSVLRIGDDRAVEVGDTVYALGNPLGLDQTFTDGILSARRVTDGIERLQISAPISPGSSGGPVLNNSGEVIGVATSFMQEGQNLNIAMPIHYVSGMLAVSNEPEPFEELAGLGAFSASETVADRISEYTDIFESFSIEHQASFEEFEPWRRQAAVRGLVIGYSFDDNGWKEIETDFEWGVLASDELDSFELTLEAGEYSVFGVCDNDCTDLDLGVAVGSEDTLVDKELDANPVVMFNVPNRVNVTVYVGMESCATETCGFWVRLYRN